MRTRTSTSSGQACEARLRCISTAAPIASLARAKATKKPSPCVSTWWPLQAAPTTSRACRFVQGSCNTEAALKGRDEVGEHEHDKTAKRYPYVPWNRVDHHREKHNRRNTYSSPSGNTMLTQT